MCRISPHCLPLAWKMALARTRSPVLIIAASISPNWRRRPLKSQFSFFKSEVKLLEKLFTVYIRESF